MARTEIERTVQPSLLDRLTDADPRSPADPAISRDESVRRFRDGVLRDVEWLLNTRTPYEPMPPGLAEVRRSAYAYGLPDTTGLPAATAEGRARLLRWVEDAIAAFEPRLAAVRVELAEVSQASAPQVRFTVSALLRMDPSPEQVVFDSVLDLASGGYALRDAGWAAAEAGA